MFLNLLILNIFLHQLTLTTSSTCSEEEEYNSKKIAQICFNKLIGNLDTESSCDDLDFRKSDCEKGLKKCFESEFIVNIEDFFIEKAIQLKQWIFLAKKLLESSNANSVFYFFSPFLINFCSSHKLKWLALTDIFYEECMHVKSVIKKWPIRKMKFLRCPSIKEYLSSGRKRVYGPVMSCSKHLNQDYNFCVQKHMNILPAKKNSSWKDACKNIKQVSWNTNTL